MNTICDVNQLVDDALHGRRISNGSANSCMTTNQAGLELVNCGVDALPAIEKALQGVDTILDSDESNTFVGLEYVVGAQLVIGAKSNPERLAEFVASFNSEKMVVSFVNCIPVFFKKLDAGFNFGIATPPAYLDFLNDMAESSTPSLSAAARRAIGKLSPSRRS